MSRRLTFTPALFLASAALGAIGACSGGDKLPLETSGTGGDGGHAPATTESAGAGGAPDTPAGLQHTWAECQASDQAFVRRAILALSGRRSWGQAEVNAYEDGIKGIRKADQEAAGEASEAAAPPGDDLDNARRLVALSMMKESAFRERWSDFLMDALHVVRIEIKSQASCYGPVSPSAVDNGALAAWVRDNDPSATSSPMPFFNMGQLLSSALELDDISVVYRGHLFAMLSRPIEGANVDFLALERSRRQDFGAIFDAAYVHRDVVCLGCHNSEFSVTYSEEPARNRAWPVPGLFEIALYGASDGKHPGEEATKGDDALRAHSMLRVADVVGGGERPFGWSSQCGTFSVPEADDPLNIDAFFGSIRSTPADPTSGLRASVWDLERSLHRGVDLLAAHGLQRGAGNQLADADEAFAYLVAENIVEKVWEEVIGSRLTIANYFPRTQVQRDTLMALTEHFIASHFSLKTLLLDILAHPVFNLKAPEEGCGAAPYELPNLLDPWTTTEGDLGKRGNSPADGVFAISSRPLLRSFHRAMEWPYAPEYPYQAHDETFQAAIGIFIKDAAPGYRGLDFQGRLTWEQTYATCSNLSGDDFIDKLTQQALATPGATRGDAVIALKDRLVGEPWLEPTAEAPAIEALLGAPLSGTDLTGLDAELRRMCGVLVSTPQFMLGGLVPKDTRDVPKLTLPNVTYDRTCGLLAKRLYATYKITCGGTTTVVKK